MLVDAYFLRRFRYETEIGHLWARWQLGRYSNLLLDAGPLPGFTR